MPIPVPKPIPIPVHEPILVKDKHHYQKHESPKKLHHGESSHYGGHSKHVNFDYDGNCAL